MGVIPDTIVYLDEKGSYAGYVLPESITVIACSGAPIINVSPDGLSMAVFAKWCSDGKKYYCVDGSGSNTVEVDETYAHSGKSACSDSAAASIKTGYDATTLPSHASTGIGPWAADPTGLYLDASGDIAMIRAAGEVAKQWKPDAEPYAAIMMGDNKITDGHVVVFKSKSQLGKMFNVGVAVDGTIGSSGEEPDQLGQNGYIGLDDLEVSSSQAFAVGREEALGKLKGVPSDYRSSLILAYVKEQ